MMTTEEKPSAPNATTLTVAAEASGHCAAAEAEPEPATIGAPVRSVVVDQEHADPSGQILQV